MNICKDAYVTFHYAIVSDESEVKDGSRNDSLLPTYTVTAC
jgi:hypothetical protein